MTEESATLCIAGFNIAILAEGRVRHDHQRKRLIVMVHPSCWFTLCT